MGDLTTIGAQEASTTRAFMRLTEKWIADDVITREEADMVLDQLNFNTDASIEFVRLKRKIVGLWVFAVANFSVFASAVVYILER